MRNLYRYQNPAFFRKNLRWYIYNYILKKNSPVESNLFITNQCNYRCWFCRIWASKEKGYMDFKTFKKVVNYLSLSSYWLNIVGGEPFINPEFPKYIDYLHHKIPLVNIVTNGFFVNEKILKKIKFPPTNISISIDAIGKKHNQNRGNRYAFQKAISAIKTCQKIIPSTWITISAIIDPENVDESQKLLKLVEKFNIHLIFQPLRRPIDPNFKTSLKSQPYYKNYSKKQLQKLINFLFKILNHPLIENSKEYLLSIPFYYMGEKIYLQKEKCLLAIFQTDFNYKGEAFPCIHGVHWKGGIDIDDENFSKKLYKLSQKNSRLCHYCDRDFFNMENRMYFPLHIYLKSKLVRPWLIKKLKNFLRS